MESIFASKFFKSSKRQDAIRAAIDDPINMELVQQLSEYLDDEYKEKRAEIVEEEKSESNDENLELESQESNDSDLDVNVNVGSSPSPVRHADHHLSDMLKNEESPESIEPSVSTDDTDVDTSKSESSDVSESSSISGESITASEEPNKCPVVSIADQTDSIMGLLNSSQDSCGVRFATVKGDNELWIYYKDSVNLNNVMEPAIALLNSADYGYLNFNRLARTDNAIVFEVNYSQKPVEPNISNE